MTKPKEALRAAPSARGILGAPTHGAPICHERVLPPDELAPFIAHFWSVQWSLAVPIAAESLPHPCVHVVFEVNEEQQRAEVTGVHTARFRRELRGRGWVFGVKVRPGVFAVMANGRSISSLRDTVVPIATIFGEEANAWASATWRAPDLVTRMELATAFLAPRLRPLSAQMVQTRDLVECMAHDRGLTRTRDAAMLLGVDVRTLERLFHRYVGATPKWVISRYRLHEAAEQLKREAPPSITTLALELGYADQAHFARDFRRVIGQTPRAFTMLHGNQTKAPIASR